MEYILVSILIGLLMAKATDNMAPDNLSKRAWAMCVIAWPVILLVIAIRGRNHEDQDPRC